MPLLAIEELSHMHEWTFFSQSGLGKGVHVDFATRAFNLLVLPTVLILSAGCATTSTLNQPAHERKPLVMSGTRLDLASPTFVRQPKASAAAHLRIRRFAINSSANRKIHRKMRKTTSAIRHGDERVSYLHPIRGSADPGLKEYRAIACG